MRSTPSVRPGLFAGHYLIEREIGQGATATVYLARDNASGESVAIKVLRPELAESSVSRRFLREIQHTAGLHHPSILPVLDSGEHEGEPYFVLPYMEGDTLRARLTQEKQLAVNDAVAIARTIAEALGYAHRQGLIHRDVKPENILFTAAGEARLSDFGIARALEAVLEGSTTSSGLVRGTPAYMSPEQASGATDYDGRSDIFSLGCVLYEMLAGIPAFIGPTAESVIAQRFSHAPRELRAYRPMVPSALEAVVMRALARDVADRYRTAEDFADAMSASIAPSLPSVSGGAAGQRPVSRRSLMTGWRLVAAATFGMAVLALAAVTFRSGSDSVAGLKGDTTLVAVLPIDESPDVSRRLDLDLLNDALSRWRGIRLLDPFQVGDAFRRHRAPSSPRDAAFLAASLGAGRYVRVAVAPRGAARHVVAALYDVTAARLLYQASQDVPTDLPGAAAAYARLADSLLLRGASADSVPGSVASARSLPAVQAFARAQLALDDWDLVAADSAYQTAIAFDPQYARANLWLAQVRAWSDGSPTSWSTLAQRAASLGGQLSERERKLADALVRLGRSDFAGACAVYEGLRRLNSLDFAAWFGLGQCRTMDRIVIVDPASPSGFSYRSSWRRAMDAYARAFEILPSVHRGYERGAFERLRVLLLVSTDLQNGYGARDSARFLARPGWLADTLALVPYPWQLAHAGGPETIPPGFKKALDMRRAEFRKIAAGWSSAYPQSAGAKHAVALSLELINDPAAIDTLRMARRLTTDVSRQIEFGAAEVMLLAKFGAPDDVVRLRAAQVLAESLLIRKAPSTREAELLAPVAALTGRCSRTEQLVRLAVPQAGLLGISATVIADAQSLLALIAIGCRVEPSALTLPSLLSVIGREFRSVDERRRVEEMLLYRPAILADPIDVAMVDSLASSTQNELLTGARLLARGDTAAARAALDRFESKPEIGVPTPDMALARARLWARLGDTRRAIRALDGSLVAARTYDSNVFLETANAAAFVRAMILRADLAAASRDSAGARRWATAVGSLWTGADRELQPIRDRMQTYARNR